MDLPSLSRSHLVVAPGNIEFPVVIVCQESQGPSVPLQPVIAHLQRRKEWVLPPGCLLGARGSTLECPRRGRCARKSQW